MPSANSSPLSLAGSIARLLRPPRANREIDDPAEAATLYAHMRPRILLWTTVGYGMFYFVRKNLSVAMPLIQERLGYSKSQLGAILTMHGLLYGLSKFLNGIAADRANARVFMPAALLASSVLNVCFGLSSALAFLGLFWMLNGWVQGMGYPPCARLLSHWFGRRELATKMSIWNASHSLGGGAIVVLCGYLVTWFHDWRVCFFVPAGLAAGCAVLLFINLRDTPESVGLPDPDRVAGDAVPPEPAHESPREFGAFLLRRVFADKYIWLASAANFFVYIIRFAVFDWGPTMLKEAKGIELLGGAWMIAGFEVAGLAGMLATGWLTDRVFRGRAAPLCLTSMLMCGLSLALLWRTPAHAVWPSTVLLMSAGFFVYGPQALVAVIVVRLASKRAAATAVGLTSIFGYASTVFSGWGLGRLAEKQGWGAGFAGLIGAAALGAFLFALVLPADTSHDAAGTMPPERRR